MVKDLFRNYVYPVAVMAGSIVGVGYLALPYISLQIGMLPMLFYFAIVALLVLILHVIFTEISLKTPDYKRFPGFVGFYLGNEAKNIALFLTIIGLFGVLLAYLIVGGTFLTVIFSPIFGSSLLTYVIFYTAILSLIIYFDVKAISKIEFWALSLLFFLLLLLSLKGFSYLRIEHLVATPSWSFFDFRKWFMPYGAILFALWGTGLIPEAEEMLIGRKHFLKRVVIIATLIPAVLYIFFTVLVVGISGPQTTDSALVGLLAVFGNGISVAALFIGVVTTFTAFVAQGLLLKKIFIFDMGVNKNVAWALTCFIPLALFLVGLNAFIPLISFIGGVFLGINGIFIVLMYGKIGGKKIIIYLLSGVFVLGIIYEIVYFLN